jgi:hypothetical protein
VSCECFDVHSFEELRHVSEVQLKSWTRRCRVCCIIFPAVVVWPKLVSNTPAYEPVVPYILLLAALAYSARQSLLYSIFAVLAAATKFVFT